MIYRLMCDVDEASEKVAKVSQAVQAYIEAVDALKAASDEVAAMFEGEEKEAFLARQSELNRCFDFFISTARGDCEALTAKINEYREIEDRIYEDSGLWENYERYNGTVDKRTVI